MLTTDTIDAFVRQDTATVGTALIAAQVLGTEVGDRVFAALVNYPDRRDALTRWLEDKGVAA